MIYLDTSCLLKLLREEPESADVRSAVDEEDEVVVSSLAELEAEVQLKAAAVGGGFPNCAAATPTSAISLLSLARPSSSRGNGRIEREAADHAG